MYQPSAVARKSVFTGLGFFVFFCLLTGTRSFAQNDQCTNAQVISVTNNGYGIGVFNSSINDISAATVQAGETFAPAILVAGQTQKSIWYKFSIPTHRAVRVTLAQNGSAITAGDIGFAVYKTSSCLPANTDISTKLTPIGLFGSTYHPCVDPGEYLVQVSAKSVANGPIYIQVETSLTGAAYDKPANAYDFGTVIPHVEHVDFTVACQSIEDATENCPVLYNSARYTKSTWHVFKTPAYFDYIGVLMSSTNSYWTGYNIFHKFGYNLYAGDARTTPISGLTVVDGCDSLQSDGHYAASKTYRCSELLPNTTYSIQIFYRDDFEEDVRLAIAVGGTGPTQAPSPVLSAIPAPTNAIGVLNSNAVGITTNKTDFLACNSRHSTQNCQPSMPPGGVIRNGLKYNLSSFFTFTLATSANVEFYANPVSPTNCGPQLLVRLYNQNVTASCNGLDTANKIGEFLYHGELDCLPPGSYTVQVLGQDSLAEEDSYYFGYLGGNSALCMAGNLGSKFNLSLTATNRVASSKYDLETTGAFDTINLQAGTMQPMVNNVLYQSHIDTFGCKNTVLPAGSLCGNNSNKAIFREFVVADSGVVTLTAQTSPLWYKFYAGDANALATAQGVNAFPSTINGLTPISNCIDYYSYCYGDKVCVVPGTYTLASFGNNNDIGRTDRPSLRFNNINTLHYSPLTAQNMGSILDTAVSNNTNTITSDTDYFSCKDNAVAINGYQPCTISGHPATKAIYRQFYLSQPAIISISNYMYQTTCGWANYGGYMTLFSGKATDGLSGLTPVGSPWNCFQSAQISNNCNPLPAGWYTVVSYGIGPSYSNPLQSTNEYYGHGSYVGTMDKFTITVTPACPGPKFNRPYKAAIDTNTNLPFLIKWGPRIGSTVAYPRTDTLYTLPKENFNCTVDTPFSAHPIPACANNVNRIVYYVFRTTQESFVQIDTKGLWGTVFAGNARTDSTSFATAVPIQTCLASQGHIQICKLQPGTYTLVLFSGNPPSGSCASVTPTIYIDQVGVSRFDHANKAYDFSIVPPDSTWRNGKPGDVNPLDPTRAPSNDFFYCTTGAQQNDPANAACYTDYLASIYNAGVNNALYQTSTFTSNSNVPRRNLWYSFVVNGGGTIRVRVSNKTLGKMHQYPFAVYRSNVDGSLPFSAIVSTGQVDSTSQQGLSFIGHNLNYMCNGTNEISFYRDPCNSVPERYYILVENRNALYYAQPHDMNPNSQVEVSILFDSVNSVQPLFDHYYQANNIGNLGAGAYTGTTDNFSCATRDLTDPSSISTSCNKTLWYKFTTTVTGQIRFRVRLNGVVQYGNNEIQLYRQLIPGDSTSTGLAYQNSSSIIYDNTTASYWAQTCISPGTYYFILPGCNKVNQNVYPELRIIEQAGDFCSAPVIAPLSGPGSTISSVIVDCHTIGTDYGEFNPTLTCPNGAIKSAYKTSWFKISITGTDTLDVTTFLTESTNALPSEIKYRMMTGNCGAMQEQSCVQDAQTQNTYKCLGPGNYFIQVFTPVTKSGQPVTGSIDLHLSAVAHADSCAPPPACLANATFIPQFDCTVNDTVTFINYSTYGSSIQYQWDFGYNNQTSNEVAPKFKYPALATAQTYTVTLTVINSGCTSGGQSSYSAPITIPARPNVNLGNDTTLCTTPAAVLLNASTWPGATYQWQNGTTAPTLNVSSPGSNTYWVKVTYNGCIKRDTIRVSINPLTKLKQNKVLCGNDSVYLNSNRSNGETHSWNTGSTNFAIYAANAGLYTNDVNWRGCIIRDSFTVVEAVEPWTNEDTTVCFPFQSFSLSAAVPGATGYTWQNGSTGPGLAVNNTGTYWVQVNFGSCIKRDTIDVLASAAPLSEASSVSICSGQNYFLPWGQVVNASGVYRDTIKYTTGCDSLTRQVTVSITAPLTISDNAAICAGQNYTTSWGEIVNTAGIYHDTLKTVTGCDSLVRTLNLLVKTATVQNSAFTICAGQNYTLPWGAVVNTAGVFSDTLHYLSGCDSLIRKVNLTVNAATTQSTAISICTGQSYTLPWGTVVNASGTYSDTLHYMSGCDSVIRTVQLSIGEPVVLNTSLSVCDGQPFTLPWGDVVTSSGTYSDTLKNQSGCDSLVSIVDLQVKTKTIETSAPVICSGQVFTLPWGMTVNTSGHYSDTLHYTGGCDSVVRQVLLTVTPLIIQAGAATICSGQNFTLPWGMVVNSSGSYSDTIKYMNGCDSLVRSVILNVNIPVTTSQNITICSGQSFTLPWGVTVNASGIYKDTIQGSSGCDSLIRTVIVNTNAVATQMVSATICGNEVYTLPSGTVVQSSGVYIDTLHYTSGCDSLITTVNLTVNAATYQQSSATICQGQILVLPWGPPVQASGIYRDTLKYLTGCDSLVRTVTLFVTQAASINTTASICSGETYALPWGPVVSTTGNYKDTLKSAGGCDSLVRTVNLTVHPLPSVQPTKSNDIDCMTGTARLTASGGTLYNWTPSVSLSSSSVPNPVASPTESTMYYIKVTTSQGCVAQDSILVNVNLGDAGKGYLVPSAFTPNRDGLNDCFGVRSWGQVSELRLSVFNRWGQLIFYTENPNLCWDGTYAGKELGTEVFVYVIQAKTLCGPVIRKGTVTLIR